ncbi:MAG: D-alanyl-D-alanine carboxypeptidase/D-alanyl-D-alanine-endopeptidase, partial [Herbaspirillum sp.]
LRSVGIGADSVGLYVQEVGANGPVLASQNANLSFMPASTMKLVTTDAALELLGPTFFWKTTVYADGAQAGDVLQGNLIIKGSGDPKLVLENFWLFLRQIRAAGIRDIRGDVVLDRSIFEGHSYDVTAFDGEPLRPYNVSPDALLLNYKTLGFRFVPDPTSGAVQVTVDPPLMGFSVRTPQLGSGNCDDWRARLQPQISANGAGFSGTYPASCGDKTWLLNPYQLSADSYFDLLFRQMWRELGGSLSGQVRDGTVPTGARTVTEWQSTTLPEIIRDINKYSNNVMARQVLLTLASDIMKLPGTPERGARAVSTWLSNKGIDSTGLVIENGSGLSRNERITPRTMGRMLVAAFDSPLMPEFVSSLPLVGFDGTMRHRLTTRSVAGNAHIKTGSLQDVKAVAGYVLAASGKRYVVVCFINHPRAAESQKALDMLLQWVYEVR